MSCDLIDDMSLGIIYTNPHIDKNQDYPFTFSEYSNRSLLTLFKWFGSINS